MWTIAECTIGIVCVSLPPLRSLFAKFWPGVFGNVNHGHSSGGGGGGAGVNSPMSPLSPHHPYARQTSGTMNTIGSNRRSNQGQKSDIDIVMSSLPSRHSRLSRHSLDSSEYDDNDTSSRGRLAKHLDRGMDGGCGLDRESSSATAVSSTADDGHPTKLRNSSEVALAAPAPVAVISEKPQRRPASGDVEMGIVHTQESARLESGWNAQHGG